MKKELLVFILAVFSSMAWAQLQTPLSLISTAGGSGSATVGGTAATVTWTMGETFIGDGSAGSQKITIGEQQPMPLTVGIEETVFKTVKVYPNPARSFVQIDNLPAGSKTIMLTDAQGKLLRSNNTSEEYHTLSTAHLPIGIYFLNIERGVKEQKSFKISITNN